MIGNCSDEFKNKNKLNKKSYKCYLKLSHKDFSAVKDTIMEMATVSGSVYVFEPLFECMK